jgi:hypothetical protein
MTEEERKYKRDLIDRWEAIMGRELSASEVRGLLEQEKKKRNHDQLYIRFTVAVSIPIEHNIARCVNDAYIKLETLLQEADIGKFEIKKESTVHGHHTKD